MVQDIALAHTQPLLPVLILAFQGQASVMYVVLGTHGVFAIATGVYCLLALA